MRWSEKARVARHPCGNGFAIEVALTYCGRSTYRALITKIGQTLEGVPKGYTSAPSLVLHFGGIWGFFSALGALAIVQQALDRGGLGGLWPQCINCLSSLSLGEGKINTYCTECGHNSPW